MKIRKFLISALAVLTVGMGAIGLTACGEKSNDGYTLSYDKSYYIVTNMQDCTDSKVVIPATYKGLPVKEIAYSAFDGCTSLTEIEIPDSITYIGIRAFAGCSNLEKIDIPDSVTQIGEWAFVDCVALEEIDLSDELTTISEGLFRNCSNLKELEIAGKVTEIKGGAFEGCTNLKEIVITADVTNIKEDDIFKGCDNLTKMTVPFAGKIDAENKVWLPYTLEVVNVTKYVGEKALFCNSKLTEVVIGEGVTSLGDSAFKGCKSLTEIVIPDDVTSIGGYCFSDCKGLTSVTLGKGVTNIKADAFYGCENLMDVYYTGDVDSWCGIVFENVRSNPIKHNNGKLYINEQLVSDIVISNKVNNIGAYAFFRYGYLESVVIEGNGDTAIGKYAFYGCQNLTNFEMTGVSEVGTDYLNWCENLTNLTLGDGLNSINWDEFADCKQLKNLTIGGTVKTISGRVAAFTENFSGIYYNFRKFENLENLYYTGSIKDWCEIVFEPVNYVDIPTANPLALKNVNWYIDNQLVEELVIPSGVKEIKAEAFLFAKIKKVVINDNVNFIRDRAFAICSNLEEVTIGENVRDIGDHAFWRCESLKKITFNGTIARWKIMGKGIAWNWSEKTTVSEVICSDGTVAL